MGKLLSALPTAKKIHRRDFVEYVLSVCLSPDAYDAKLYCIYSILHEDMPRDKCRVRLCGRADCSAFWWPQKKQHRANTLWSISSLSLSKRSRQPILRLSAGSLGSVLYTLYSVPVNNLISTGIMKGRGEIVLRISSSSVTTSSGARGYLILTNHRLLFSVLDTPRPATVVSS